MILQLLQSYAVLYSGWQVYQLCVCEAMLLICYSELTSSVLINTKPLDAIDVWPTAILKSMSVCSLCSKTKFTINGMSVADQTRGDGEPKDRRAVYDDLSVTVS